MNKQLYKSTGKKSLFIHENYYFFKTKGFCFVKNQKNQFSEPI